MVLVYFVEDVLDLFHVCLARISLLISLNEFLFLNNAIAVSIQLVEDQVDSLSLFLADL
jgi:hypothetical protein